MIPLSMVSLGILFAFALAMTWASLKLLAGSGPPSFTATAISLPIMVKIFPFAASFFSFLCLIFANFECPDIFFYRPFFRFPIISFFLLLFNLGLTLQKRFFYLFSGKHTLNHMLFHFQNAESIAFICKLKILSLFRNMLQS